MTAAMAPQFNRTDLKAHICRMSFYDYVREMWDTIIPQEPSWNWHIKYICDELQTMSQRVYNWEPKLYDEIINISPGTTKSTVCSVMYPGWAWANMPSFRFIGISYTMPLSHQLSLLSRDVIQSDKYRELFPYVRIRKDMNTKSHFANTLGGSRFATTIGGSVTGMHGHAIGIDDPLDPTQAASEQELATALSFCRETIPSRKVDKKVSFIFLIMQRLHELDPTGDWLSRKRGKGLRHVCLPARLTDKVQPPELADRYINGLMDPVRLNDGVLNEALLDLGEYGFAGQYLQWPVPREGGMFKAHRILVDTPPQVFKCVIRYWDKAGTLNDGAFTCGVKMGLDLTGRFWLLDVKRFQLDSHQREQVILQTARIDGKGVRVMVEQEPGSGGKESAEATVRLLAGFNVKADRVTGDKETRADPYSAQVNGGNVYMVQAEWNAAYINELTLFPRGKYKDQVDASSGAFAALNVHKRVIKTLGGGK